MVKTKIVLDTNILISSVGWKGNPRKIFEEIARGNIELVMSLEQFYEFSRVLDYPKLILVRNRKIRLRI